jgi:hypothetical protein
MDEHTREGRCYTRARRFPWVIGQIQGWTIPFGPYTATQLGVLLGGLWLVVQTFGVWSQLGPFSLLVLAMPPLATWAVRHARIDGRSPFRAACGLALLLAEPGCGRIHGRLARPPRPVMLTGAVRVAHLPQAAEEPIAVRDVPTSEGLQIFRWISSEPTAARDVPRQRTEQSVRRRTAKSPEAPAPMAATAVQALLADCARRR